MAPEELGQLIDLHAAALVLYARQWCASPDDVVQDALIKLANLRTAPPHVVPWLYAVVRNGAISAARSEQRRRRHESSAARSHEWFVPAEHSGIDAAAAANALAGLPLDEREAIVAHLWGGLTFEQIGKLCDSSAATAHRRYVSGLESLRQCLGEPCPNRTTTPH